MVWDVVLQCVYRFFIRYNFNSIIFGQMFWVFGKSIGKASQPSQCKLVLGLSGTLICSTTGDLDP